MFAPAPPQVARVGAEGLATTFLDKDPRGSDVNPQGTPFAFPPSLQAQVIDVFSAGYDFPVLPDEPRVRRLLDFGAGCGAFACWGYKRFKAPWIDCVVEADPKLAAICERNLPPGGKLIYRPEDFSVYDAVRIDSKHVVQVLIRHRLDGVKVILLDWYAEDDRKLCEDVCSKLGLRLFVSKHTAVSRGRQVWARSTAQWDGARYVRPQ